MLAAKALDVFRQDIHSMTVNGAPVIDSSGAWIGKPTGLQGPPGPEGPQGEVGPTGPAGASPFGLNGTDAFYDQGNVGIGTQRPAHPLEIQARSASHGLAAFSATAGGAAALGQTSASTGQGVRGINTSTTSSSANPGAGVFGGADSTCSPCVHGENTGYVGKVVTDPSGELRLSLPPIAAAVPIYMQAITLSSDPGYAPGSFTNRIRLF